MSVKQTNCKTATATCVHVSHWSVGCALVPPPSSLYRGMVTAKQTHFKKKKEGVKQHKLTWKICVHINVEETEGWRPASTPCSLWILLIGVSPDSKVSLLTLSPRGHFGTFMFTVENPSGPAAKRVDPHTERLGWSLGFVLLCFLQGETVKEKKIVKIVKKHFKKKSTSILQSTEPRFTTVVVATPCTSRGWRRGAAGGRWTGWRRSRLKITWPWWKSESDTSASRDHRPHLFQRCNASLIFFFLNIVLKNSHATEFCSRRLGNRHPAHKVPFVTSQRATIWRKEKLLSMYLKVRVWSFFSPWLKETQLSLVKNAGKYRMTLPKRQMSRKHNEEVHKGK